MKGSSDDREWENAMSVVGGLGDEISRETVQSSSNPAVSTLFNINDSVFDDQGVSGTVGGASEGAGGDLRSGETSGSEGSVEDDENLMENDPPPLHATQLAPTTGYLTKQGSFIGTFRRRFFVLEKIADRTSTLGNPNPNPNPDPNPNHAR